MRASILRHAALLLLAGSRVAAADPPPIALSAAVPACQACHGRDGVSHAEVVPNLAGQKAGYLMSQLEAFRAGTRKNDSMSAIASQLDGDAIRSLARYWASQAPMGAGTTTDAPVGIPSRMRFPAGFPDDFVVYETVVAAADGQVVMRYANRAAVDAARLGRPMTDGAAIVVATHEARQDEAGRPTAGNVLSYATMQVVAGRGADIPQLLRNADWDYALFAADGTRRDGVNTAVCLACHKPLAADDHVFTLAKLRAWVIAAPGR